MLESVELIPSPVLFIKSIAEQGYSLATSLADLIDNSIAAGASRIEVLLDKTAVPYTLMIADNGCGMSEGAIQENMRFPSNDLELQRNQKDLGRFGLGLKTASFSQTRKFTVLSRTDEEEPLKGRCWDVDYLAEKRKWCLLVSTSNQISDLYNDYDRISSSYLCKDRSFKPKTIVCWSGLYKLELKGTTIQAINEELDEVRSHLGLVFHRFISDKRIAIRLNNKMVDPFDPFPASAPGLKWSAESTWIQELGQVKCDGVVLPKSAIEESKASPAAGSIWTPAGKSLADMEGIYVYRSDRLISYGHWLRTRQKSRQLQLARFRINFPNTMDAAFQINVAKSSIKLPYGLKKAILETLNKIEQDALLEFREKIAAQIVTPKTTVSPTLHFITREITAAGPALKVNRDFPIITELQAGLDEGGKKQFITLLRLFEIKINQIWKGDESRSPASDAVTIQQQQNEIEAMRSYLRQIGANDTELQQWLIQNYCESEEARNYIVNQN